MSADGRWRWNGSAWVPAGAPPPSRGLSVGTFIAIIAGGAAVVLVVVALLGYAAFSSLGGTQSPLSSTRVSPSPSPSGATPASTVSCDRLEHTQVHYHAALQILQQGSQLSIPTGLGRITTCFYWLHMHDGEPGIIHVESPSDRPFTLGDFFAVWDAWSRSGGGPGEFLDSTHVATFVLAGDQKLVVYVDAGAGPQLFAGDPTSVVLRNHEVITLEITPPAVAPPPAFSFPPGF